MLAADHVMGSMNEAVSDYAELPAVSQPPRGMRRPTLAPAHRPHAVSVCMLVVHMMWITVWINLVTFL